MQVTDTLPNTLNELLDTSLNNLYDCEKDDNYAVDFNQWHNYVEKDDTTYVSPAGAVLAKTLKIPFTYNEYDVWAKMLPGEHNSATDEQLRVDEKLQAIRCLEVGNIGLAYKYLTGRNRNLRRYDRRTTDYHIDRNAWWSEMMNLRDELREARL